MSRETGFAERDLWSAGGRLTPPLLVLSSRHGGSPLCRLELRGSANCPFGSAYVCHLGARPLQGREPSRIETVPFGRTLAGVAGRELFATHVLGTTTHFSSYSAIDNRSTEMRDACRILTPNGDFYYCLFCTLDPGAKPRPIDYRMADVCGSGFRNQGYILPTSSFRLVDPEKAPVRSLRALTVGLSCPSTQSEMKPAKRQQLICGTISAWIAPRCNTPGLLGPSLPSRRSARE